LPKCPTKSIDQNCKENWRGKREQTIKCEREGEKKRVGRRGRRKRRRTRRGGRRIRRSMVQ
jgi:hypothetical protein